MPEDSARHRRSIETRLPAFNAALRLALLVVLGAAGAAAAVDVPGTGGRLEAGGWLDGLAVVDTGDGPRQRPQGLLSLRFDGRAAGVLRGHLEVRARAGGPFEGGHPGVYNLVHAYQNYSPALELREAWVDVLLRRADLRLGVQTFAWGALDGVPPTDVLTPRDYHDPFVADVEERKIGIPAARGTWFLPAAPGLGLADLRATLVYVPFAVPPRLALREERWFPPSVLPGGRIVLPAALLRRALPLPPGVVVTDPVTVPVVVGTQSRRPPARLDAGGIGLRFGGTWRDQTWNLYHYTGPETAPDLTLRPVVRLVDLDVTGGVARLDLRARSVLRQEHETIHMTGADWARALGAATVRAEAAWFVDRPSLRIARDLFSPAALRRLPLRRLGRRLLGGAGRARVPLGDLFVDRDAVEWGVGADYLVRGFLPLIQVNQVVGLEDAPRLLLDDPETRFTASLRKSVLADRVDLELRAVYTLARGGWYALPRIAYRPRDDVRLRVGYLAVGGSRASILGQFGEHDEVIFEARYTF